MSGRRNPIKRSGGAKLYEQVSDYVREKIYSKEWGVHEPIPSEHELMDLLQLSRGTVQKGIRALVDEGLLVQQRGRGTFVTKPVMARPSSPRLVSFAESMEAQDIAYETRPIELRVEPASVLCARKLHIDVGQNCLYLTRVRSVKGSPVMYIESYLNLVACPGLENADFAQESLFSAVERCSKMRVGASEVTYSARVAGKVRGSWLQCDEHAPVLNLDQIVRLENGTPFEWGSVWLPANRCVIVSESQRT